MNYLPKPCMRILALGLLAITAAARADQADTTNNSNPADYSNWFQVEIIVFALKNPAPSDEMWSTPKLEYPGNMLAISPPSDDQLEPANLQQLQQLLASGTPGTAKSDDTQQAPAANPSGGYMFEDKSRFSDRQTAPAPPDQQQQADNAAQAASVAAILNAKLPQAFRALPESDLHLNRVAGSIRRSSLYTLLLHTGWLQPIVAQGPSWPVLIQTGDRYGSAWEVDGTLTISRSRYLHVNTDLWFTRFKRKYEEAPPLPDIVSNMDPAERAKYPSLVSAAENDVSYEKVQTYPMTLSRRMRSATMHYLDNPYFGVLIEVDEFKYTPPAGAQSPAPTSSPSQ